MRTMVPDVRHAVRLLAQNPGFTAVAVLTLGIGIAASTAIFSLVNGFLLRPLPFESSNQLVLLQETNPKQGIVENASFPNFSDWRRQNRVFEEMAALTGNAYNLSGSDRAERVSGMRVTAGFFPTLRVKPVLGRGFLPQEDSPGGNRTVMLSYGAWAKRFGSDPNILGRMLTLDGERHTVIGVLPASFRFFDDSLELWTPLAADYNRSGRMNHFIAVVARLRPDSTLEAARTELTAIARQLEQQYRDTNAGFSVRVDRLQDMIAEEVGAPLLLLLVAVGFVLLIGCANIANLLLSRGAARTREVAIRAALGAGRLRIVRQMLTESLVLSVVGGSLGLLLAYWGTILLTASVPSRFLPLGGLPMDRTVLLFALAASMLSGIIFGLAPALRVSRTSLSEALKASGRATAAGSRAGLRNSLVVAQMALAMVLLVSTGLLIKSFLRIQQIDPGFRAANLLTAEISLPEAKYSQNQLRAAFYEQALERISRLPGVEAAAAVTGLPLGGSHSDRAFVFEGYPPPAPGQWKHAAYSVVTEQYFRSMGVPLRRGREFSRFDNASAPRVVVINETMARQFWPNEDPIGKRIKPDITPNSPEPWLEITGIVGNTRQFGITGPAVAEMYVPHAQNPAGSMFLTIRTAAGPASIASAVRSEIRALDRDQAVANVRTMERVVSESITPQRLVAFLLGGFAAIALTLASMGLYGVVSCVVAQRTHELGIRIALGAGRREILRLVVGKAGVLILIGVGIGLAGAFAATRLLSSLLYGVNATDPVVFVLVPLTLGLVALAASYAPARRATRVDPIAALRCE